MMMGAISVPLFTLFGLDGLRLRVDDCKPSLLITNAEKAEMARACPGYVSSLPMPLCSMSWPIFRRPTVRQRVVMIWLCFSTLPAPRASCRPP